MTQLNEAAFETSFVGWVEMPGFATLYPAYALPGPRKPITAAVTGQIDLRKAAA